MVKAANKATKIASLLSTRSIARTRSPVPAVKGGSRYLLGYPPSSLDIAM
jgi:hypothetical protein